MSKIGANAPNIPDINLTGLRVEQRPPGALRPAGRQSRHHPKKQMDAIRKSIETFGFVTPVLVNRDDKVLAGNARIEAAKVLGLTSVPVVVVDHLTPEQQRAFVLADNRLAELGSWNKEVLELELEELSSMELDFSIEATGFRLPEIDAIRFGVGGGDAGEDDVPEPRAVTCSRLGDLWLLGNHRLLVGDATSETALDQLIDGEQAHCLFPPYNVRIEGNVTSTKGHGEFVQGSGEMSEEGFTEFLTKVCRQAEFTRDHR